MCLFRKKKKNVKSDDCEGTYRGDHAHPHRARNPETLAVGPFPELAGGGMGSL